MSGRVMSGRVMSGHTTLALLLVASLLGLACSPGGGQHLGHGHAQAQGAGLTLFKQGKAKRQFGVTLIDLTSGVVSFDFYQRGDDFFVVARNTHHGVITTDFQITTTNLKPTKPYSSTVELPGGAGAQAPWYLIATFTYQDRTQPWRAHIQANGQLGSRWPSHDPRARYLLPYRAGERYQVLQGPRGSFSHFGPMEHAIDFDMPQGATVTAMRAGKVAFSHDRATHGANDPSLAREVSHANLVAIEHEDGTLAMYTHLMHRGVLVRPGQRVRAGQPIGLSGATGFVSKPHLHVALQIAQDAYTPRTLPLPILLRKDAKRGTLLTRGESHTAFDWP